MSIALHINGKPVTVENGATMLDACKVLGIDIPTLCYLEGCSRFTSCMVCVVKDTDSGRILPACSALAQEGMQIDTESAEIRELRQLRDENKKLKQLVADLSLDRHILQESLKKKY